MKYKYIKNSFGYFLGAYVFLGFSLFFIYKFFCLQDLKSVFLWVYFGSFLVGLVTQLVHSYNFYKSNNAGGAGDLLFQNRLDALIRCLAGLLETILYTFFFAVGLVEIVAGYLVMKVLSTWKPKNESTTEEGRSTSALRIAVVLSLLVAFVASYFLNKFFIESGFNVNDFYL